MVITHFFYNKTHLTLKQSVTFKYIKDNRQLYHSALAIRKSRQKLILFTIVTTKLMPTALHYTFSYGHLSRYFLLTLSLSLTDKTRRQRCGLLLIFATML